MKTEKHEKVVDKLTGVSIGQDITEIVMTFQNKHKKKPIGIRINTGVGVGFLIGEFPTFNKAENTLKLFDIVASFQYDWTVDYDVLQLEIDYEE